MRRKALALFSMSAVVAAALAGCQSVDRPPSPSGQAAATGSVEPFVGKWGFAAYHRDTDRPRTEKEARSQCSNAYVISKGPNGGVMMNLADEKDKSELFLKQGGGKSYLGPPGPAPMLEDSEVLQVDSKSFTTRYMDPDASSRYGTSIYVRCGA